MNAHRELMDMCKANAPELARKINGATFEDAFAEIARHVSYPGKCPNFGWMLSGEMASHPAWGELLAWVRGEKAPSPRAAYAPCPLTPADIQHAATEGRNTERDRMLARLMSMEPSREPYSKLQSEWGRREARRLWERMRDAIVDGKEAHKDRDALEGGE